MKPGKISRQPDGYRVEFERKLNHPIDKVWDAITNPEILKIWFTEIDMEFKVGGKMIIYFADEAHSKSNGEIVNIQPPHLFEWTWEGEVARWELTEESESSCTLKLSYSKFTEEYAAKAPAGFHIILDQLQTVLDGRTESYLLGATTEDPVQKQMEQIYKDLLKK